MPVNWDFTGMKVPVYWHESPTPADTTLAHGNLAGTITTVMVSIVNDTELAGSDAVNGGSGMHHVLTLASTFERGGQKLWCMANL